MSFARNLDKNIGKNISKNLSSKYSEKVLDHAKQSDTDALKTASKRAEATTDFIVNTIADEITKTSKLHNRVITNEHDKEIPKERYISPEKGQKIIDDLSRIMKYQKIMNLLDNTPNLNLDLKDDAHGTYNTNSQIKFKTLMLKSSLCNYSDANLWNYNCCWSMSRLCSNSHR